MKNKVVLFVCAMFFISLSSVSIGQERTEFSTDQEVPLKNEIHLQISDGVLIEVFDALFIELPLSVMNSMFVGYSKETVNDYYTGHLTLGYDYQFKPWFSAGMDIGFQGSGSDYRLTNDETGKVEKGKRTTNVFLLMPKAEFTYLNRPIVQLYGDINVGMMLYGRKDEIVSQEQGEMSYYPTFAFHVNPIGVRIGKQVAGFAEVGFGFRGFVTAGLSVKF